MRGSNPRPSARQADALATELTGHVRSGGGDRHRTRDIRLAKAALCQLSYTPTRFGMWFPVTGSGAAQSLRPISAPRSVSSTGASFSGLGRRDRTADILLPKQALSLAELCRETDLVGTAGFEPTRSAKETGVTARRDQPLCQVPKNWCGRRHRRQHHLMTARGRREPGELQTRVAALAFGRYPRAVIKR